LVNARKNANKNQSPTKREIFFEDKLWVKKIKLENILMESEAQTELG
jgi:hypothetical protein